MSCADGSPMPSPKEEHHTIRPILSDCCPDVNAAPARFVSQAHCCCGGFTVADLRAGEFGVCR
jgi:hypothetical protein